MRRGRAARFPQSRRPGDRLDVGGLSPLGRRGRSRQTAAKLEAAKAKSAIFINLGGGPSHTDTFDLKPTAPTEYRGSFQPIDTNVRGIRICEHLPKLAASFQHFALFRSVTHTLAAHELGTQYVITGNRPIASLDYPSYGAVVSKELPGRRDLPPFVAIPNTPMSGRLSGRAILGPEHQLRAAARAAIRRPRAFRWATA